jgi:aerobic-type carbon monoxide dehydrogenase small subunit (CoxS/CutS family)
VTDRRPLRLAERSARPEVEFTFDGQTVRGRAGDTVAMALWAAGLRVLRHSSKEGAPRGVLCNMGICYECLVRIEGASVRACLQPIVPGLVVESGGRP